VALLTDDGVIILTSLQLEKGKRQMDLLRQQMEEHQRMTRIREDDMTSEEKKVWTYIVVVDSGVGRNLV